MPNWCYQNVTIKGPAEDRQRLHDAALAPIEDTDQWFPYEKAYSLKQLVPLDPRALKELPDNMGTAYSTEAEDGFDGYQHAIAHWGTKWGDCETQIHHEDDVSYIQMNSAWSPANNLLLHLSKLYPTLLFCNKFTEEFNHFAGCVAIKDGKVLDEYWVDVEKVFFNDGLAPSAEEDEHAAYEKAFEKMVEDLDGAAKLMISNSEKVLG